MKVTRAEQRQIDPALMCAELVQRNFDLFTGVPDSLLSDFSACASNPDGPFRNITTANEGNAIALAAGYHLSSGHFGVAYFQNSGIGNAVNPLLSLTDKEVYAIPMLLIIGWRGEPGKPDEPQHVTQGELTLPLLETMDIPYQILGETPDGSTYSLEAQLDWCTKTATEKSSPVALVVKKGSFSPFPFSTAKENLPLTREDALEVILDNISQDDLVVATTGKTARELFELRKLRCEGHDCDFLTVGSMGHTASIALGMSLGTNKAVYCIDGDGSFLMHMGSLATIPPIAGDNFKYIINNNGAHESVGGQATVAREINIAAVLTGLGFTQVFTTQTQEQISDALAIMKTSGKCALIINTRQGSRPDLGRPTQSPVQNKQNLMENIKD